jgi:hypothetical protein
VEEDRKRKSLKDQCVIEAERQARLGIGGTAPPLGSRAPPQATGENSQVMIYCLPTSKFRVVQK